MAPEPNTSQSVQAKTKGRAKKYFYVGLFALTAFVGLDGYYNRWGTIRRVLHWNKLVLTAQDGALLSLKAQRDFELVSVENPFSLLDPDSLASFDRAYREAGKYRVYFRLSDSASAQLQQLHESLSQIDTGGTIKHSIDDAKRAYGNILRVLRIDTTKAGDTLTVRAPDSSGRIFETRLLMESDQEFSTALKTMLSKSPQLLVGVGLGIALSAGVDLLQGRSYLASADSNVFRAEFLRTGTRCGEWEGKPIDVLWVFAPEDSLTATSTMSDSTRHER